MLFVAFRMRLDELFVTLFVSFLNKINERSSYL